MSWENVSGLLRRLQDFFQIQIENIYLFKIIKKQHGNVFKTWLCPNFLLLPKKSELPKIWGGCSPPRPPGPYAYVHWTVSSLFFCCVTVKTIYIYSGVNFGGKNVYLRLFLRIAGKIGKNFVPHGNLFIYSRYLSFWLCIDFFRTKFMLVNLWTKRCDDRFWPSKHKSGK